MATPKKKPNPARVARARLIVKGIRRLLAEVVRKNYRIGTQLNKLADLRLYDDLGYDTFRAALRGEKLLAHATARRLMAIARTYTEAEFNALGTEKAHALITFIDATPEPDIARILLKLDPDIEGKPLSEHSAKSLKRAVANLNEKTPKEPKSTADRVARIIREALERRGAKNLTVEPKQKDGRWIIEIRIDLQEATLLTK